MNIELRANQILKQVSKLPIYKVHPFDTYSRFKKHYGISNIKHPKDTYYIEVYKLNKIAQEIVKEHKLKFGLTGFGTGFPGGPAILGTTIIDLEEYMRRIFILAQEIGHIYGVIPNPFFEGINSNPDEYFESVKEDIMKAVLVGLGVGGVSMGIKEIAKRLAQKEAKEILRRKVDERISEELMKKVARVLGMKASKETFSKIIGKAIPLIGGGVNGVLNYNSIKIIGNNLINSFEREHMEMKKSVIDFWNK